MALLLEYKQNQAAALKRAEKIVATAEAEKREITPTESADLKAALAEVDDLTPKIQAVERATTLNAGPRGFFDATGATAAAKFSVPTTLGKSVSLREAMAGASAAEALQVRSFAQYLGGDATALADLTPTGDGGVFIPTLIAGVIARNYGAYSPVRDAATVWPTAAGEPARFPVISDTESAEILAPLALTGADEFVSGSTPPTSITGPMLYAHKFSSRPVLFPRETIADANINVVEEVLNALLARITRSQNLKYTSGLGGTEPRGFMPDALPYAAGSIPLDLDIALDLAYAVPALYRPNGKYMASDVTVKYLRKLKTGVAGDKRALWKDAFEEGNATLGTPARLHGYELVINNDMPSVATDGTFAGVSPLAFGDFKRFIVREADQGAPYVYRYSVPAKDGGAVIAFKRSDSALIVPAAIAKLTN